MLKIDEKLGMYNFRHEAMATEIVLSLGGVEKDYARQAAQVFFARVDEIESKLSLYRENSDVTRINLLRKGDEAWVSQECIECLQIAMAASHLTKERFHPFLGVRSLSAKGGVPVFLKHLLCGEMTRVSGAMVEIDPASRKVRKVGSEAILDFGGVGKGFALDEAIAEIEDWEVPTVLANFGGRTLLFKSGEDAEPWTGSLGDLVLDPFWEGAFSSSGIGFQGDHIVGSRLRWDRSFSRSNSAALADALSTGAMLMGAGELEELCSAESGFVLAVTGEKRIWGAERFCSWKG